MDSPAESWKDIPKYTCYEASTQGRVRNKKSKRVLKTFDNNGYLKCTLYHLNKGHHERVHRLIAMAYCEKQEGKDFVNHKDENKQNNIPSNLEWVNGSENTLHYYKTHPTRRSPIRIRTTEPDGTVHNFNGLNECGRHYGVSRATIWGYSVTGRFRGITIERLPIDTQVSLGVQTYNFESPQE